MRGVRIRRHPIRRPAARTDHVARGTQDRALGFLVRPQLGRRAPDVIGHEGVHKDDDRTTGANRGCHYLGRAACHDRVDQPLRLARQQVTQLVALDREDARPDPVHAVFVQVDAACEQLGDQPPVVHVPAGRAVGHPGGEAHLIADRGY